MSYLIICRVDIFVRHCSGASDTTGQMLGLDVIKLQGYKWMGGVRAGRSMDFHERVGCAVLDMFRYSALSLGVERVPATKLC
jgi:hypothetical protein